VVETEGVAERDARVVLRERDTSGRETEERERD
jgi:hypothetical protein